MSIFISVVVPCYNVQDYVRKCLFSLIEQERQDVEFIIVNDGSTDNTFNIIKECVINDSRFVVINKSNGGVSSARNAALKVAKGKYFYLLDGDDYLSKNALDLICLNLSQYGSDLLLGSFFTQRGQTITKIELKLSPKQYDVEELYSAVHYFPMVPKLVYRTAIVQNYDLSFNERLKAGEVYAFLVNYLRYAHSILVIDDALFYYVIHNASAVRRVNCTSDLTVLKALEDIYENGNALLNQISFHITAFKLVSSFTYSKYVKNKMLNEETLAVVKQVLRNRTFKGCLYKVALCFHLCHRERFYALYMILFSILGFRMLIKWKSIK